MSQIKKLLFEDEKSGKIVEYNSYQDRIYTERKVQNERRAFTDTQAN